MSGGDGGGGRGHVHARERDGDRDRAPATARGAQHEAPSQPETATAPMTPISFAKAFGWGAGAGGAAPTPPPAPPPSPLGRPVAAPGSGPERAADAAEARQRGAPDLTGVRVHTDARADGYARTLGADALTLGQDIFVARAAWNPGSATTHALLAHELHHAHHGQAGVVYRKATIPPAPTSSALKPQPHSAAAADDARVAKSADPALNGKTVAEIRTLLRAKLGRYQTNARLLKESAHQSQASEERWASERTWAERASAYAAGVALPDPKRWAGVAHLFEIADGQLTAALAQPATGDTLPELGLDMARGLKSFQYGVQESQARSRDFARYTRAVADSSEAITDDLTLVRDIGLAVGVSLLVVTAAPALFALGATPFLAAGGTATTGSLLAGSATVAGGATAIGATYEGEVRYGAKALHEATKVVEAVFDPDTTIDAALGQIDWKGLGSETYEGAKKGAIDGLIAAISYGADKLAEPLVKAAGGAAATRFGGASAFGQMAIRVMTRALAAATAGGASGAVIGALQGALDAANRGGGKEEILAAAKDGFVQGGLQGVVIGGAVGLGQAASAERSAARAVPEPGGAPAAPSAEPTLQPEIPDAPHAEPTLSPEAPSAAPAADAPGVAAPAEPAPLAESPAPPTAHDAGPHLSAPRVEPPALVDVPPAAEPGSIPAELAPEGAPTNSMGEPTVTPTPEPPHLVVTGAEPPSTNGSTVKTPKVVTPAGKTSAAQVRAGPAEAPTVHGGKQGKHIPGHPNYTEGRSILLADPAKLAERAGSGSPANDVPRGQAGFKERVDFGEVIGDFVKDGVATPTTKGIIIYAKDNSIHIVPAAP